CARVQSNFDFW
nr:immunoglobulin heavy chain junction region [Macaca mulatta]MOV38073.1 immunoglobulin heavy chain junction region [Macaca mulatta]MOV38189.1 immunoglobulin heavy chain junction region [Macaca mulatta]MOV38369.1 immunoglobulin heavy chain junction region [Macaca mulatta]MOV38380.1 immunoglobulin heavy chain junction region [Macaca mulatta]